jgi:thymidylate synthase (FAD)
MEFLVAGYEIIEQEPGLEGIFKAAELPGRICYGSQDKMAPGTAEKFVNGLMKSNHGAPLEHGTVYLKAPEE